MALGAKFKRHEPVFNAEFHGRHASGANKGRRSEAVEYDLGQVAPFSC